MAGTTEISKSDLYIGISGVVQKHSWITFIIYKKVL